MLNLNIRTLFAEKTLEALERVDAVQRKIAGTPLTIENFWTSVVDSGDTNALSDQDKRLFEIFLTAGPDTVLAVRDGECGIVEACEVVGVRRRDTNTVMASSMGITQTMNESANVTVTRVDTGATMAKRAARAVKSLFTPHTGRLPHI